MSIEEFPLKAKDGMTITMCDTFIKLMQLHLATRESNAMRQIMDKADIPGDDRMVMLGALTDRINMLSDMLRSQVGALAALKRQGE